MSIIQTKIEKKTKPGIAIQLSNSLDLIEKELRKNYQLIRVANNCKVVIYFTPIEYENKSDKLPAFYLAIRTYTKIGSDPVGPRIEIGTRDEIMYDKILRSLPKEWQRDESKYRSLDEGAVSMVLSDGQKMSKSLNNYVGVDEDKA